MDQLSSIESQLKLLWEKAQEAGVLIARLREEKKALESDNEQIGQEVAKLRSDLAAREAQLQKLTTAHSESAGATSKSASVISNGERDQLTSKVKELLARIDAYL
ncbi:MAG: hypothetical protein ABI623_01580 [bacterium]